MQIRYFEIPLADFVFLTRFGRYGKIKIILKKHFHADRKGCNIFITSMLHKHETLGVIIIVSCIFFGAAIASIIP